MAKGLDEVLGRVEAPAEKPEAPAAEPEQKAEPEVEAKPEKPRDESGKFKKGEEVAETPTAKSKETKPDDPETGLKAGITAERKKRQEAERRAAEYHQQLEALRTPTKTPDVLEDPDGYRKHIESGVQAQLENQRVDMSAEMARAAHTDFDEVLAEWAPLMQENPALYQQALKAKLPAEWAYQYVKRERFLKEVGDNPDSWRTSQREAIEKELREKLEAEFKARESSTPQHPVPPPSLASASSGGRITSGPSYAGRKPFEKIFGS